MKKAIQIIATICLLLFAIGFAGATATIDTSSLPNEFEEGSAYVIPITVSDISSFKLRATYNPDDLDVSFEGDSLATKEKPGDKTFVNVCDNGSSSLKVRVTPLTGGSSTLALSFDEANDMNNKPVTLPGETISFKVTSVAPTSRNFASDEDTASSGGIATGTDISGTASMPSGKNPESVSTGKSQMPSSSSDDGKVASSTTGSATSGSDSSNSSGNTESKKTPAIGVLGIVAAFGAATVLRRKF